MPTKPTELTRLTARHSVKYSRDFPQRKPTDLTKYTNVDDVTLKRAPSFTMEGVANSLIADSERAEQEAIRANPPVYDRSYVERADYSLPSLYSDYRDYIEGKYRTWADYTEERKKWRRCKHKFCVNMFPISKDNFRVLPAKRKDSRYCSDECRKAAFEADKRYEATGSYLPVYFYLPEMAESVGDKVRRSEFATEGEGLLEKIDEPKDGRRKRWDKEASSGEVYPVKTYRLSDSEIKLRRLQQKGEKDVNSRRELPYISDKVEGYPETLYQFI